MYFLTSVWVYERASLLNTKLPFWVPWGTTLAPLGYILVAYGAPGGRQGSAPQIDQSLF